MKYKYIFFDISFLTIQDFKKTGEQNLGLNYFQVNINHLFKWYFEKKTPQKVGNQPLFISFFFLFFLFLFLLFLFIVFLVFAFTVFERLSCDKSVTNIILRLSCYWKFGHILCERLIARTSQYFGFPYIVSIGATFKNLNLCF